MIGNIWGSCCWTNFHLVLYWSGIDGCNCIGMIRSMKLTANFWQNKIDLFLLLCSCMLIGMYLYVRLCQLEVVLSIMQLQSHFKNKNTNLPYLFMIENSTSENQQENIYKKWSLTYFFQGYLLGSIFRKNNLNYQNDQINLATCFIQTTELTVKAIV